MVDVAITLKLDEHSEIEVPFGFRYLRELNIKEPSLYYAKFEPPIKLKTETFKSVHFTDFSFNGSKLIFAPEGLSIELPEDIVSLKIIMTAPVAEPLSQSLNPKLISKDDTTFTQVFFLPHDERSIKSLKYLGSLASGTKWSALPDKLVQMLKDQKTGHYGVSVGILQEPEQLPEFLAINEFFSGDDTYLKGSKVNIVVLSAFKDITFRIGTDLVSVDKLATVPKNIIKRIYTRVPDREYSTIERRMIKACLNGGVPLNLVDALNLDSGEGNTLKSTDFEQIVLDLDDFNAVSDEILAKLDLFIKDFREHLFVDSPEAAFRTIFWDPVLNRMFRLGLETDTSSDYYQLRPEWNTRELLFKDKKEQQNVDYAVTFKLAKTGRIFPILLAEMGKLNITTQRPPKDQSKVYAIASQAVIELAYALISAGKDPKLAKIFGMWIGGTTVQLFVAHAVVTVVNDIKEIHANITVDSSWFLDLAVPEQEQASPDIEQSETPETVQSDTSSSSEHQEAVEDTTEGTLLQLSDDDEEMFEAAAEESAAANTGQAGILAFNNITALLKINWFVQHVKSHIALLNSSRSDLKKDDNDKYKDKTEFGILIPSLPGSSKTTPARLLTVPGVAQVLKDSSLAKDIFKKSKSDADVILIRKYSLTELELLRKLSMFPAHFPVLFDYLVENGPPPSVQLVLEKLQPVVDPSYLNTLSPMIMPPSGDPVETFYGCLCFALETSFALYRLHEHFNIVHSDISLANIMYSEISETWKLLDFNQSMTVEESERTERIAGTRGFVAPESVESKIFNKASDVFSLGKVLHGLFFGLILEKILVDEYDVPLPKRTMKMARKFLDLTEKMIVPLPADRPVIWDVVEELFDIFYDGFDESVYNPIYPTVFMAVRDKREAHKMDVVSEKEKEEEIKQLSVEEEKESVSSPFAAMELDPKRPRVVQEEKEPKSIIPNTQIQ